MSEIVVEGNISLGGSYIQNDDMYYVLFPGNVLQKHTLGTKKFQNILYLNNTKIRYWFIIKYKNKLYLIPYDLSKNCIIVISMCNNQVIKKISISEKFDFEKLEHVKPVMIVLKNNIYIQIEEEHLFIAINSDNGEYRVMKFGNVEDFIGRHPNVDFAYVVKKQVFIANINIEKYRLLQKDIISPFVINEKNFFVYGSRLVCKNNSIYYYDKTNGIKTEIVVHVSNPKSYGLYYGLGIIEERYLWMLPMDGEIIIKVDLLNNKITEIDVQKDYGIKLKRMYKKAFVEDKKRLFFYSDDSSMPMVMCSREGIQLFELPQYSLNEFISNLCKK